MSDHLWPEERQLLRTPVPNPDLLPKARRFRELLDQGQRPDQIADAEGLKPSTIQHFVQVLRWPADLQEKATSGELTFGEARRAYYLRVIRAAEKARSA